MTAQLRSQLLKLRTTRTTALLLLGAVGLTLFATCVEGISPATGKLAHEQTQRDHAFREDSPGAVAADLVLPDDGRHTGRHAIRNGRGRARASGRRRVHAHRKGWEDGVGLPAPGLAR